MKLTSQLFRLNRYLNILSQQAPVSSARLEVMRIIKKNNPVTLRQLADQQKVAMPTMSKLVDELQNQSMIIRAQSKDDARQRLIVPTQRGLSELEKMEVANEKFWQEKLASLDSKQVKELENNLENLLVCFSK